MESANAWSTAKAWAAYKFDNLPVVVRVSLGLGAALCLANTMLIATADGDGRLLWATYLAALTLAGVGALWIFSDGLHIDRHARKIWETLGVFIFVVLGVTLLFYNNSPWPERTAYINSMGAWLLTFTVCYYAVPMAVTGSLPFPFLSRSSRNITEWVRGHIPLTDRSRQLDVLPWPPPMPPKVSQLPTALRPTATPPPLDRSGHRYERASEQRSERSDELDAHHDEYTPFPANGLEKAWHSMVNRQPLIKADLVDIMQGVVDQIMVTAGQVRGQVGTLNPSPTVTLEWEGEVQDILTDHWIILEIKADPRCDMEKPAHQRTFILHCLDEESRPPEVRIDEGMGRDDSHRVWLPQYGSQKTWAKDTLRREIAEFLDSVQ